jgi:putative transposase
VKYAWIDEHSDSYPVARLCRLFQVSRSGYLRWQARPPSDRAMANAVLDAQVATIHAESRQSYGRPRIVHELGKRGVVVGHERVRRSLSRQALHPVYKRPYRDH